MLNMYASAWVFGKNLFTSFVSKLKVSTGHDDIPVGCFGKMVDDAIPDSLVRSGYNNVSDLVHWILMNIVLILIDGKIL